MMTPRCCLGMAHYATNPGSDVFRGDRFVDPGCLIHVASDGQVGIIIHDDSGRYSIIQFCPWCGAAVGMEHEERTVERIARSEALLELGRSAVILANRPTDAPRSHKAKGSKPKGRQPMSEAKRQALSEKMRLLHAQKKRQEAELVAAAAAPIAPGQDEAEEMTDGV